MRVARHIGVPSLLESTSPPSRIAPRACAAVPCDLRGTSAMMILVGRTVIFAWALGIAYVGYLLVGGEIGVMNAALEAGRTLDVVLNAIFTTLVATMVAITVGLFLFVGVANEGS